MYKYSQRSASELATVDVRLQNLFNFVLKFWDHTIIDGIRTIAEQEKNVARGVSKTMDSKHLSGRAIDAMPYPINWDKIEKGLAAVKKVEGGMEVLEAYMFQGFVAGVAAHMGINIRQGVDWNSNRQFEDQSFNDIPHTELVD